MHALLSMPKFYVQVRYYCFFMLFYFSSQTCTPFDVHSMLCVCIFVSFHINPQFLSFGRWELVQQMLMLQHA